MIATLAILLAVNLSACRSGPVVDDITLARTVTQAIEAVRNRLAPEQRLTVFEVTSSVTGGRVIIQGKVMTAGLKQAVGQAVTGIKPVTGVENRLIALPDLAMGNQTVALARGSVVNLGVQPLLDTGKNLATQAIMGEKLHLLEEQAGWYRVQMGDGYLGWVRGESVVRKTNDESQQYRSGPQAEVVTKMAPLTASPGSGVKIAEAVQGCVLPIFATSGTYLGLTLPSGDKAWVDQSAVRRHESYATVFVEKKGIEAVIATARQYMGLPYLWGGTTSQGFDCSGFTQFALKINGYSVLRDADQQITQGDAVQRQDLRRGDLVFFTAYKAGPSHMGIYLGNGEYLHSSGKLGVGISSLDSQAKNYDAELDRQYLGARRLIR